MIIRSSTTGAADRMDHWEGRLEQELLSLLVLQRIPHRLPPMSLNLLGVRFCATTLAFIVVDIRIQMEMHSKTELNGLGRRLQLHKSPHVLGTKMRLILVSHCRCSPREARREGGLSEWRRSGQSSDSSSKDTACAVSIIFHRAFSHLHYPLYLVVTSARKRDQRH